TRVREIAEQSFAHRSLLSRLHELANRRDESEVRIRAKLERFGLPSPVANARALERLVSARSRLVEPAPQTRAQLRQQWLDSAVKPGRVVGIGRSGRRLVLVTGRRDGGVTGVREDGRLASFALERIGRVFEPVYPTREEHADEAFAEIHQRGNELALPEPRLRDASRDEEEAARLIDQLIDSLIPAGLTANQRAESIEALWSVQGEAQSLSQGEHLIESLRSEVWTPFERCARVLDYFGYLEFAKERVTDRGRWLADLHVDRPLLIGEALQRGMFAALDSTRAAALVAALAADEDRDYGELELDDSIVN